MRLKTSELAATLRSITGLIAAGDSFGGNVEYELVGPDEWEVSGCYRFGNSNGQGSVRLIDNLVRESRATSMWSGCGDAKALAWADACKSLGITMTKTDDDKDHPPPECETCIGNGQIRDGETGRTRKCLDCNGSGVAP